MERVCNLCGQDDRENYFFVVDLHAITVPQDPKKLEAAVTSAAATFLAAGVDPKKSKVFIQVKWIIWNQVRKVNFQSISSLLPAGIVHDLLG